MTAEMITIIGTGLTVMTYAGKVLSEMKQDIRHTTTINVETKGKLEMINMRLEILENNLKKVQNTTEDISGYLTHNSDFVNRKNQ